MKVKLITLVVGFLVLSGSIFAQNVLTSKDFQAKVAKEKVMQNSTIEKSENAGAQSSVASESKEAWDVLFTFNAVAAASPGLETDGTNFYTTLWNGADFHRYDMDGSNPETFTVAGVSNVRDMAYDGQYFYGAAANMSLYQMDLANGTLVSTISATCSGVTGIRHIAYDPTLDGGNGGFWIGNWSELGAIAMDGSQLVAGISGVESAYGSAYDNYTDAANPRLLLFQQTGSLLEIHGYDINTATLTGLVHDASDVPGAAGGSAGGMCIYEDLTAGVAVLAGDVQLDPNLVFGYELAILADPGAPAAPTNLVAVADAAGALSVDVSWNNPSETVSGDPLTELTSVELFLNDETTPIYTSPTSTIGELENYMATVTTGGMNTFTVVGANSLGTGLSAAVSVFVGIDVAATSSDLPDWAMIDDVVTPTVTVTNIGAGAQTFDVTLTDGTYNETVTVTDLAAGTALDIVFPDWTATPAGMHTFTVTATDPGNDVNLANNTFDQDVLVVDGCEHELALVDSWGDGWNDNTISVSVNGAVVLDHVTIASGTNESFFFFANDGDAIEVQYFGEGGWPEENSWTLYDGLGDEILSGAGPDPIIQNGVALCTPPTIDLATTDVTPDGMGYVDDVFTPSITVYNNGINDAATYDVEVVINDGTADVYTSTKTISTTLASGASATIDMDDTWTAVEGTFTVTGTVTITGDEIAANDAFADNLEIFSNEPGTYTEDGYAINAVASQFVSFDPANGGQTNIAAYGTDPFPMASDYDGEWLYVVHSDLSYVKIDGDGTVIPLGTISGATGTPTGLAYNEANSTMYLVVLDASNVANLYTLSGTTATFVGAGTDQMIIAMDFADDGMLYGPAIGDDQLYQIDPADGSATAIGPIGFDANFGQDVSWEGGALYTYAYGDIAAFGVYDLASGAFVQIAAGADQIATMTVFNVIPGPTYYTVTFGIYDGEGTIEATVDGTPIASGDQVEAGSDVNFTATPADDYEVVNWWYNGEPTGITGTSVVEEGIAQDITVEVQFAMGINEVADANLNVYPNPSTGLFNVEVNGTYEVTVMSATGNVVYTGTITNNGTIDLNGEAAGIYFLQLKSDNQIVNHRIMVK